jgi:hypothetical protein
MAEVQAFVDGDRQVFAAAVGSRRAKGAASAAVMTRMVLRPAEGEGDDGEALEGAQRDELGEPEPFARGRADEEADGVGDVGRDRWHEGDASLSLLDPAAASSRHRR